MSQDHKRTKDIISDIEKNDKLEDLVKQVTPKSKEEIEALPDYKFSNSGGERGLSQRREFLQKQGIEFVEIDNHPNLKSIDSLKGNIENFIGMAQVPIGLAGPLLVNGTNAVGDFFIPLATTEGALVASYNRGMKACRLAGGITALCISEGIQRSPLFKFESIITTGFFVRWINTQFEKFEEIVSKNSNHAKLTEVKTNIEGNSIILTFEFRTGDAAGQNMATICTNEICQYILEEFEIKPIEWYIESNYSGDKKATALSFSGVRGKKVTSDVVIDKQIVVDVLKTTPEKMVKYWQSSTLAVIQSGSIGAQGHVANALTALFIACGQDVACISESSVGLTRMEINSKGNLYVSLTLPSLTIGTIGGGTRLGTQKECLEMLGCYGEGKVRKFAEICCAVALAGEVSIAAAISARHFAKAHKYLGRKS